MSGRPCDRTENRQMAGCGDNIGDRRNQHMVRLAGRDRDRLADMGEQYRSAWLALALEQIAEFGFDRRLDCYRCRRRGDGEIDRVGSRRENDDFSRNGAQGIEIVRHRIDVGRQRNDVDAIIHHERDPNGAKARTARLNPRTRNARDFERSEEHTSELQSLMRISYAVFCLKKKINTHASHYTKFLTQSSHLTYTHT